MFSFLSLFFFLSVNIREHRLFALQHNMCLPFIFFFATERYTHLLVMKINVTAETMRAIFLCPSTHELLF